MAIDVTTFHKVNVTDTCAVWNVISSQTLYRAAKQAQVLFCITSFVHYECLIKSRHRSKAHDLELQKRLRTHAKAGDFVIQEVQLQDLMIPALFDHAGRIGKGEISTIAFAYRTRQAVLTDDQRARRLADIPSLSVKAQTTPHLLGWLIYCRSLLDGDYRAIVAEHQDMKGTLQPHMEKAYLQGLRARCLSETNEPGLGKT